ncbi:MAG: hypothetical protein AAFO07_27485 [Bacteroidota bacterium]
MKGDEQTKRGNVFDRIFKENAEAIFLPLINQVLNLTITSYQPLREKLVKTLEREVDFLYEVVTENQRKFLLHLEFQSNDDKQMIYRIAEYHGLIIRKYQLPVKHVVIYLGSKKPKMRTELSEEQQFESFDLLNIKEIDANDLLSSQIPEVILLALLSKYDSENVEKVIRTILFRLTQVAGSKDDLLRFLKQLTILARLRKLEVLAEKLIFDMPIYYDVETDGLYLKGLEKGKKEGREEGIEQGLEQGALLTMNSIVYRCLKLGRSIEEITAITGLDIEQVQTMIEKRKDEEE